MSDYISTGPATTRSGNKGPAVLEVRNLRDAFGGEKAGVPAAVGLDYEVRAGEVVAVVGGSGSCKSASSMALLGLLLSNGRLSGSVKLSGKELLGADESNIRSVRGKDVAVI